MSALIYIDKNCPHCDAHFNAGRRDKKFCSTKCKSGYHNKKKRRSKKGLNKDEVKQRRNERVLKVFFQSFQWERIPFALLELRGYDFDATHQETTDPAIGRLVRYHGMFGLSINDDLASYQLHMIDEAGNVVL